MNRWGLRFLLCVLLGGLTTVVLAWTLVFVPVGPRIRPVATGTMSKQPPTWQVFEERRIGFRTTRLLALQAAWVYQSTTQLVKAADTDLHLIPLASAPPENEIEGGWLFRRDAAGFPLPALYCESTGAQQYQSGKYGYDTIRGGIAIDRKDQPRLARDGPTKDRTAAAARAAQRSGPDRTLPYLPIWRGFIVDSALYTLLWLGVLMALSAVIRGRRRAGGSCPGCNYDLRGQFDAGCPECGWKRKAEGRNSMKVRPVCRTAEVPERGD